MRFSVERKGRLCLMSVLALTLAAPVATPQNPSDADLMSLSIEDLAQVKVYSASRHLEEARQAPSAVTIITAQDIRRYGWRTLGDALRSLRGFYTAYDRQYAYLGVRGFLRPGDYNSRILLLVNGHRINENVYDSAPMGTEFPLDLDLIDRIEVVRGPGSSLFGSNAIFGVINVITRQPSPERGVEISGDTSSFLGRRGRITAFGHKGQLSGLVSGTLYRDPGASDLFFPEFASPETNNGFAHNMDGTRAGYVFADVTYGNFRLQGNLSDRTKKYPTASYGAIFNDPADHIQEARGYLDASYHRSLSPQTDVELRSYYDVYKYTGSAGYLEPGAGQTIGIGRARADWAGVEANLNRQIGKQRITFGGTYESSFNIDQHNYVVGQPDLFQSKNSSWLAAGYGEMELHFIPKVTISAGARLDWFSTFGGAISPRVALIYSPTPRTSLKYIFGRAFRAPSSYEEYYVDNITVTKPPEALKPESIQSHELVLERSLKPWLSVTADAYYNQLEKLIDQVPDPASSLSYFVNQGRVHSKGLEFEAQAQNNAGLGARASYAFTRAQNEALRSALANSPSHQAKLNATLPILRRGFAGVELLYISGLQDYRQTRVSPFALTNFTLSTRPLWGGWELSASLYNAFNRSWYSPMGPNDPEAAIQQDGRTYRFTVAYTWHREKSN